VVAEAPDLAVRTRAAFEAAHHATMATLRIDGAPRISGVEVTFTDDEVYVGCMPGSRKVADLGRDGRIALHSASPDPPDDDPTAWSGDAKVGGVVTPVHDPAERAVFAAAARVDVDPASDFRLFRIAPSEVVAIRIGPSGDHLEIASWHPGRVDIYRRV